jgi:hypothetical protein
MNKKITMALVALMLTAPITANASVKRTLSNTSLPAPTLAILDTAIDTSLPAFKDKIAQEVCLLERGPCPNGTTFMEGPGAASMPSDLIAKNGFGHGTEMTYIAIANNPNMKIVFIRIIGNNPDGIRQVATEAAVHNALQWVIDNKDKYNIKAVSMAQAIKSKSTDVDYCQKTPITQSKIQSLVSVNVPVFLPAGNDFDYKRINWPACLPESIAIGATMPSKSVAVYTNYDEKLIDFFAQGTTVTYGPNNVKVPVAGTSASIQSAAADWVALSSAKPGLTYNQMYDLISRTSTPTSNSKIKGGKLINLQGALNG